MGQFRTKLGLKPELYDPDKAISTGDIRADFLLEDELDRQESSEKSLEQPENTESDDDDEEQ